MPRYAELPNGTRLEFPDETPDAVMDKVVKGHITGAQQPTAQEPSMLEKVGGFGRDVLAGAVKGASNIGATALYPLDAMGVTGMTNEERRAKVDQFMQEHGADTESMAYGGGKLATEIAGTAGVGGLLARGTVGALPTVAKYAPQIAEKMQSVRGIDAISPRLATAIESGGFATGAPAGATRAQQAANALTRVGGGAATGATMAGMVDPNDLKTGAILGGAMPIAGKVAGTVGEKLGKALRTSNVSPEVAALAEKAAAQGIDIPADRLVDSPSLNALAASLRYVPFSGRAATETKMEGQLQRALSRTFGQDTENITKALRDAHTDLGAKFEATLKTNAVKLDDDFLTSASTTLEKAKSELSESDFKIIENQINNMLAKAKDGIVDGNAAYNIKKDLDRIGARNSNEAWYANQLKKDLMGALNRSLGPEKAAEFAKVRQQYGNMLDLEPLAKAGAEGDISIARLANMRNINNPQLQEVADIAAQFVKPRESQHGAMQRVVLGGLGAGAAGMGVVAPVVGGLTAGKLSNALLNSKTVKKAMLSPTGTNEAIAAALRNPALRSGITLTGQ